jgi:hypothetical protein
MAQKLASLTSSSSLVKARLQTALYIARKRRLARVKAGT